MSDNNKNPFTRTKQAPKKETLIETKSTKQIKVDISRKMTLAKLQMIPFLKTLDASFFVRAALFSGVIYYVG